MIQKVALLDFETTGFDPHTGSVIEGAVALVDVTEGKRLSNLIDTYASFNDPGYPIPPFITKITGITDGMVRGHALQWDKFNAICESADLLIAHNAKFDRGWLEVHGGMKVNKWACTRNMIDWRETH